MKGRYRIITINKAGQRMAGPWINNLIMQGADTGTGIIMQQMIGNTTYALGITSGELGTGNTAPTVADTDLETPVVTGIVIRRKTATATTVTLELFVTSEEMPDNTYREFGLRAGTQLIARSLISPTFTKTGDQDAIIEYEITID